MQCLMDEMLTGVLCKDFLRHQSSLQCGMFLGIFGAALSFISSDLIWLTICWGIIFGAGIGISSPEPLKVSQKFRTQPFFLLICCAAPSFACILLPYFLQFLLSSYGLCGCLLIVSGITLNAAPFIMVASYRIRFQLPLWRIRKKYEISDHEGTSSKSASSGIDNECFELESSSLGEKPTDDDANIIEHISNSSSHQSILLHKTSSLFPVTESNAELSSTPTSRKNNAANCGNNNAAFENDLIEEDVLFELSSNVLRNQANPTYSKNGKSDFAVIKSDSNDFQNDTSCRSRRDTIVSSLPKQSLITNSLSTDTILHQTGAIVTKLSKAISIESIDNQPKKRISINNNKFSDPPSTQNGVLVKPLANFMGYPLEIKVHVVECTYTEDDVREGRLLTQSVPNTKRSGSRRHSNSLITSQYNNINSPNFSKKYCKSSNSYGCSSNLSSNMYLISEDDELTVDAPSRNNDEFSVSVGQQGKRTVWWSSLKKIIKPTCLVVVYAFVIHEVTLVTLLTIFDDHIDGLESPATGVLPAYGLGGILGRLSVKYWGERLLLEGSHATAALLFILHGVVVAGILWSPNIYWIGGFYVTIGYLEIAISTAVWNLVIHHIEVDAKSPLFTTCKLLCGICSLFVPYTIGLSRDVMGEYDGLLQITSGLSVLCAILCYILPKFTFHTKHARGS